MPERTGWIAMVVTAATGAMVSARRQLASMAVMVARAASAAPRRLAMAVLVAMAALAVTVLPEIAVFRGPGPMDLLGQMGVTAVLVARVAAPSRASLAAVALAAQRAMVDSVAMVVLEQPPPVGIRRKPVATEVMEAAAGWVAQAARAAALALWAPTATVAMEVPVARPELPAMAVMAAQVMRRTPMVRWEALVVILEPQELAAKVVLPESVGLQVRLVSTARAEPQQHPEATAAMAAMDMTT